MALHMESIIMNLHMWRGKVCDQKEISLGVGQ